MLRAEVNVYVRHAYSLRVQEPLKNKLVPYGIYGRYAEGIGDQASRGASPPRPHGNIVFLRVEYKVGDHEEIRGEPHLADGVKLRVKPLPVNLVCLFGYFVFAEYSLEIFA